MRQVPILLLFAAAAFACGGGDSVQCPDNALDRNGVCVFARQGAAHIGVNSANVPVAAALPLRAWLVGLTPNEGYTVRLTGGALTVTAGGSLDADASGVLAVDLDAAGSASPVYTP